MALRDPQPIALSRQAVLLVTAVGVGLIATSYILGVQVGKDSASLRKPEAKGVDEQLKELPEPLLDQLKLFQPTEKAEGAKAAPGPDTPPGPAETREAAKPVPAPDAKAGTTSEVKIPAKAEAKAPAKADSQAAAKSDAKAPAAAPTAAPAGEAWTLQLVATGEKGEADRVAARAKAAGFPARVVKDGRTWKVRLARAAPKEAADAAADKLRSAGFKPFAVRAE